MFEVYLLRKSKKIYLTSLPFQICIDLPMWYVLEKD